MQESLTPLPSASVFAMPELDLDVTGLQFLRVRVSDYPEFGLWLKAAGSGDLRIAEVRLERPSERLERVWT